MADEKKDKKAKKPAAKKPAAKKAAPKKPAAKKAEKKAPAKKRKAAPKETSKKADPKAKGAAGGSGREAEQPPGDKPRGRSQSRSDSSGAGRGAKPAPLVVRASSRYVRIAPRKARLVADQVRGLQIEKARALLQFSPRGAARDIGKLIESAAANAENNHDLVADEMRVAEITVDEGPTLRRFRPRALGRATPINKRTSHIAVALSPEEEA